uniref:efflux RND transporter periplasmic adaptor subunit n=1 Tax=Thaumasiovibrio occultus TaxID=1891184 RepID=UPI00131EB1EA|nr:efflux RND transporter periplasmic adaptor subunit [Thaumasiovibrio occultus]
MQRTTRTVGSIALAVSLVLSGCKETTAENTAKEPVVRPVRLFTIADTDANNLRRFPANVLASEEAIISFRVAGELVEFPVKPADIVEKGALLAKLDDRDYRTDVQLRKTDYDLALRDFERVKTLRQRNVLSQADYDNALARVRSARAALKLAEDRLADTKLVAPFSGRVAQTAVENFEFVQPQQTILVLQSDNTLDVSIQLPENILNQINQDSVNPDYRPTVSFAGRPDSYPVTYKQHATQATPGTQAYEVVFSLAVPENGQTIYPGMGATLSMDMAQILPNMTHSDAFLVPLTAVLDDDASSQAQVWVYNDGIVEPRAVEKLRITNDGVLVSGDLNAGTQIVSAGLNQLTSGMTVKPLERERGL